MIQLSEAPLSPDAMSCLVSHRSASVIFFAGRRRCAAPSLKSSGLTVMPEMPRRPPPGTADPPASSWLATLASASRAAGSRSAPVFWSTSRMDRPRREPVEMTLTHTSSPRLTPASRAEEIWRPRTMSLMLTRPSTCGHSDVRCCYEHSHKNSTYFGHCSKAKLRNHRQHETLQQGVGCWP